MKILLLLLLLALAILLITRVEDTDFQPVDNIPEQYPQTDITSLPIPDQKSQEEQKQEEVPKENIELPLTPEPAITQPLDLTLPMTLRPDAPRLEKPEALLPNVFREIEKENRLSVSGSPILKAAEEEDALPTLEGATIEIEVKID